MSAPEPSSLPSEPRRAVVLRHHVEDDAGLVGRALAGRGYVIETVLVDAEHPAPDAVSADLIVVLGSNGSVYTPEVRASWLDTEMALLARADTTGTPIFGVCFGAQILCELFGGRVERAPVGEIGWVKIEVRAGVSVSPGPWFEYHGDRCLLPESAEIWATSEHAVQVFGIGRHVGVQFHPEIDEQQLARWFESQHGASRAYSDHETALLEETRREGPAATLRTADLVDFVLAHAFVSA